MAQVLPIIGEDTLVRILADNESYTDIEGSINHVPHVNGGLVEVLVTIAPIIVNNRSIGFYLLIKDITEQKKPLLRKRPLNGQMKLKASLWRS